MNGRTTWIRIYAVPNHAWNKKFFERLCISKGSLISLDSATENKKRLDMARCLVKTTSMDIINRIVQVMINDYVFRIKMEEEFYICPIILHNQSHAQKDSSDEEFSEPEADEDSFFSKILEVKNEEEMRVLENNFEAIMNNDEQNVDKREMYVPNEKAGDHPENQ